MLRLLRNLNPDLLDIPKGRWQRGSTGNEKTALISCPTCGNVSSLSQHTIDDLGRVTPSLMCPHGTCDFHDFVHLVGWSRS